jgi:hypothetical protein
MSEPIYRLFIVRGYNEAYYALSAEQRAQFWNQMGANAQAAGSRSILVANARWASEECDAWGLEEFPSYQAIIQVTNTNEEQNQHYRYLNAQSILGTPAEGFELTKPEFSDPILQLWMVKNHNNEPWLSLSEEERNRLGALIEASIRRLGGVVVIGCDCAWSNEEYAFFGITAWPNLQAEQAHFKDIAEIGWHRYFYSKTILGVLNA